MEVSPIESELAKPLLLEGEAVTSCLRSVIGEDNAALVHGKHSFSSSLLRPILESQFHFDDVWLTQGWGECPTENDVVTLAGTFAKFRPSKIIAVGGGSVLDLAKAARVRGCPDACLVAIPSTAGSGSEATPYASILINHRGDWAKVSEKQEQLRPAIAVLDVLGLEGLPLRQKIISGVDAISQAVESFWSVRADDHSRSVSKMAIRLLRENIESFVFGGACHPEQMLRAAYMAGQAISIAPTNICHAISYPLTARFGIPHGWAVGLILPSALRWHKEAMRGFQEEFCAAFEASSLEEVARWIEDLFSRSGMSLRLSGWGIVTEDLKYVVANSYRPDRMGFNFRPIDPNSLHSMLRDLL